MLAAVARFRWRLQLAVMAVITAGTLGLLFIAQRRAAQDAERVMRAEFQTAIGLMRDLHALRHAALLERSRELAGKPALGAALADGLRDRLYPNAIAELHDMVEDEDDEDRGVHGAGRLHAEFFRFLDRRGSVIEPGSGLRVGPLLPAETAQLALRGVPRESQIGYLVRSQRDADGPVFDVITTPIPAAGNDEPLAALVLGFEPASRVAAPATPGIARGIWLDGKVYLMDLSAAVERQVADLLRRALAERQTAGALETTVGGVRQLLFFECLNPGSQYAPAYEVCLYSLAELEARQSQLRRETLGAGGLVLLFGLAISHLLARRFAQPVERFARDSEEHRMQRQRAEQALEQTSEELQRAARFSADASHQLKTPVAVLRAGLEEMLAREMSPEEAREEIGALIRQTYRLSGVIEDLLLLSRLDAGRLHIEFDTIDLVQLIAAALDDLSVRPDPFGLEVAAEMPARLFISAEKRYATLILLNLVENAGKYNRPGGRLRIVARACDAEVELIVGNTGTPIAPGAQAHIFERFHRGAAGENVPGYGLGLNLARELARLHGGALRLVSSADDWTEFAVRFRAAPGVAQPRGGTRHPIAGRVATEIPWSKRL